jgi:cytochrome c peroxidase
MKRQLILLLLLPACFAACRKTDTSRGPIPVPQEVPAFFPTPAANIDNPLTQEGIELGRQLFYDKRLSGLNPLSCASCHHPDLAFTDGVALSQIGASGLPLHRNAPALFNMAWNSNGFFWDGGSTNLESQAFAPLTSPDEMHQNLFQLIDELKAVPDYVRRFEEAFSDGQISTGNIARALAQFQRTLVSAGSRYDRYRRREGASLNTQELQGLQLVQQRCASCHDGELFTDNKYHNNGIDADFSNEDAEGIYQGRFRVTRNPADLGKFRTPSLRNLLFTAPYMHDGRFATLQEVLDHYDHGVKESTTLDPEMRQRAGQAGIPLDNNEKQAIIQYLATLTDTAFARNPRFAAP